jgi:TatD DNase family protein
VFTAVLRGCADVGGRILSVHSRRAAKPVLEALADCPTAGTAVLHWFSGTERELTRAVELGCWFSVGPAMLDSDKGRRLVELMPRDRVLTESDGPFATVQGRSAVPWDVSAAVTDIAKIWSIPQRDAANELLANLRRLTSLDATAA